MRRWPEGARVEEGVLIVVRKALSEREEVSGNLEGSLLPFFLIGPRAARRHFESPGHV